MTPSTGMTVQNKAVVRRMIEQSMVLGDVDAALTAYSPDFVYHNAMLRGMAIPPGPEVMRPLLGASRAAFADMQYTIEALIAEDDKVAVLYSWTATHTAALGPIPATGRPVSATGVIVCRLTDGKIVEQWDVDDRLDVMQQLGIVPAMPDTP